MAFHQPTRQSMQRVARPSDTQELLRPEAPVAVTERPQEESQTWVLFAPTEVTTTSYLSETEHFLETPGRSRVGDLGSFNSVVKPDTGVDSRQSALLSTVDDASVEDDAELDSLDSHLPEFRSIPEVYSQPQPHTQQTHQETLPVFPGHDGLGSFHLDQPALGPDAQEQIYQFERFNPKRSRRRRESLDLTHLDLEHEQVQASEKRDRIEAWRLEHSRVLLSEIQRETRRRRLSQASQPKRSPQVSAPIAVQPTFDADSDIMTWHDEDAFGADADSEGFISRITRRFMRDVMGMSDKMISILLGEASLEENEDLSSTPRASQQLRMQDPDPDPVSQETWQLDVLERVSRELGVLVSQISHHPGAFSTYSRVLQTPLPYAGLPIIPELNASRSAAESASPLNPQQSPFPQFHPTIQSASQPIDIRGRAVEPSPDPGQSQDSCVGNGFTEEEWERDLDVKLVFRYLRSRFMPRSTASAPSTTAHLATSSTQDTAAKFARVRQHHPLVSRMRPAAERRTFKATVPSSPVALRHPSSCASQSTRRSARRSSVSSRHYWDIGGSLGTGSVISPNGPMGSWGEV